MHGLEAHILVLIKHFLGAVGYPGIFALMTIEGFGIPVPSELTMPFSGFLTSVAGGSRFALPPVILVGAVGEVAGGVIAYALGYYGGRPALERYGRIVLLSPEELERGEHWFRRYGDRIVLVVRLLPVIRSFIALPAGVVRMPIWRFVFYSAIGSLVWCAVLAFAGHALGQHWNSISKDISKYDPVIVAVVVLLIAFGVYKRVTAGRGEEDPASESAAG